MSETRQHADENHAHGDHSAMNHEAMNHSGHGHAEDHSGHHGRAHHAHPTAWGAAAKATLHCLTGCAIGEILGMIIGVALGWHGAATVALSVALAFVFGYALTMWGIRGAGLGLRRTIAVALAADTVSIIVMEIIDNSAMVLIPGAMDAGLSSWVFWVSLAGALLLAFVITTPINKVLIARGKGHAVVHGYH